MNEQLGSSKQAPDTGGMYPIRTVAALTGVNPVTLRAWERRYGLIRPTRTPKGHRLYSTEDVELVRRVVALLDRGIPISQAKRLMDDKERTAVRNAELHEGEGTWPVYLQRMQAAIGRFDDRALDAAYNDALSLYPMDLVTRRLLIPLTEALGERAQSDPIGMAEQGFFRVYLRNKLGARFHHQSTQTRGPKLLAACLPGEDNELDVLLFGLAALTHGYRVVQLGANTPLGSLATVIDRSGCQAAVLYGSLSSPASVIYALLADLVKSASVPILVGGRLGQTHGADLKTMGVVTLSADPGEAMSQLDAVMAPMAG